MLLHFSLTDAKRGSSSDDEFNDFGYGALRERKNGQIDTEQTETHADTPQNIVQLSSVDKREDAPSQMSLDMAQSGTHEQTMAALTESCCTDDNSL